MAWIKKNWFAVAFVTVVLVSGYIALRSQHEGLVTSRTADVKVCERGNQLRDEVNSRIPPLRANANVLKQFLLAAAEVREEAGDPVAAADFRHLAHVLDEKVKYKRVPLIDCEKVYPKVG